MKKEIKVYSSDIQEYLYTIITRANRLYHILFLTPFPCGRIEDAEEFIRLHKEYNNITDMLRELQIFNWLNVDLYDRNDIIIK